MEYIEFLPYVELLVHIMILVLVVVRSMRLVRQEGHTLMVTSYTFGLFSFLMSDFFWLAYIYIRPDTRMPFAGNVIGEWAGFQLFAAALSIVYKNVLMPTFRERILTVIFTVFNAIYWIAWNGKWFEDIGTGIVFGYYLCTCVRCMKQGKAFSRNEWRILRAGSFLLVLFQGLIFVAPEDLKRTLDVVCYILMFTGILLFFVKIIRAFLREEEPRRLMSLTFAGLGWTTISMYMSADPIYFAAALASGIMTILMTLAVEREVRKE